MNVALDRSTLLGAAPLEAPRRVTRRTLGMPELCLGGLSETWLLKACGDAHWRLIADLAGRAAPDFRDPSGDTVYAAFCATQASDLTLDAFEEHDELTIASDIVRTSRTRFASTHCIVRGGAPAGRLSLLSTFVKRAPDGGNRSIAKAALAELPALDGVPAPTEIAALPGRLRPGRWSEHRGFRRGAAEELGRFDVRPCPTQDFNGAELLYFSAYQGFVDRAEWELLNLPARGVAVREREIVFHGNLEPDERLTVRLRGLRRSADRVEHWTAVEAADGRPLADCFTTKALSSRAR